MNSLVGRISRVQHFSTGDGPGIRTTVFFQGCNLHCAWCHNPETIPHAPVLLYYQGKCTHCGACAQVCPVGAHGMQNGRHMYHPPLCGKNGACEKACPSGALLYSGRETGLSELMGVIMADKDFYADSGGGVTLSGGEPLCQPGFAAALARLCRGQGLHVLLDTALSVPWARLSKVLPFINEVYADIKGAGKGQGEALTGWNPTLVHANLARLLRGNMPVTVRIPVIPGHTENPAEGKAIARELAALGVAKAEAPVHLLPFHRMGGGKYTAMGGAYPYADAQPPSREAMDELCKIFTREGLRVSVQG